MKKSLLLALLCLQAVCFAQESKSSKTGTTSSNAISAEDNTVYTTGNVDTKPIAPGNDEFTAHLIKNLVKHVVNRGEEKITAYISFIVEKDGALTNCKVLRSAYQPDFNSRIIQVLSTSPKWTPGTKEGQNVRTEHRIQINL